MKEYVIGSAFGKSIMNEYKNKKVDKNHYFGLFIKTPIKLSHRSTQLDHMYYRTIVGQ